MKRRGSILVAVLWCMVLLSMVVIGVLHTARTDLSVVKNYGDRVQAHYLALAGVERAKALIYQDTVTRQQTSKSHTGSLYDDAKDFAEVPFGRGHVQVFRRGVKGGDAQTVYGISDEESRLNINTISLNQLTNNSALRGMTADIAASIVAWRSPKTQVVPGGAQTDYYMSLKPPYQARNGPFQTVRELLMVRGVTPRLLMGTNANQPGTMRALGDEGWSAVFTVTDTDKNVGVDGKERVNVQTADESALTGIPGITSSMAQAIISYRGQHRFETIADLMDVTQQQNRPGQPGGGASPGNAQDGPKVISEELFSQIADEVTVSDETDLAGLVNINTASLTVLECLPGILPDLAQAIVNARESGGYFASVAGLLKVEGMTRNVFKQVLPLVTVRSETYRIIAEGKVDSTETTQRVEEIVHIGRRDLETLSYREDL
jgi:competence ComEA-like helix-hairpin-helix protein